MVTDRQVRRLMELLGKGMRLGSAAAKADMDEKTARKYRSLGRLPDEVRVEHSWQTREDPFDEVWAGVEEKLRINPGLEAKTLFEDLQRRYRGRFGDGQLRTLQRRVKIWRALQGPPREVFFPQVHKPGELCQSDFTSMNSLGVTIERQPFEHLLYHFVLTYSNWETGTICFSESFESLSEGLQNALWELGGVPEGHRTDRLSAAVQKPDQPEEFTQRYRALLDHYDLQGHKTQAESPNENGDGEQRHYRLKKAVEQSLMLRGSCDFASRQDYAIFLDKLFVQLNAGRQDRFKEESGVLRHLPPRRLDSCKKLGVRVGPSSTIRVKHNVYSVDSRLIGEWIQVRLYAEHLEVTYGQRCLETIPRLRGEGKHRIQYRHIIDWLVRKPGAFDNYRYREELFPTHRFRMAYDGLRKWHPSRATKEYLGILHLAARENEAA
ncbi:MAG: IS21 family transposase, partial [Deltaproteobacteria bacterium]